VLQVEAVECVGIQEDRHGVVKRDAVLRRVGLGLPRVPLEHVFSIYGISRHAEGGGPRRPPSMPQARSTARKKKTPKRVLALPDLEHAKSAVLSSLTSRSGQRTYDHAIREFVAWYCSEPRLAFNRTAVLRYRIYLEQRQYAPATINLRLAAVRRVAYEAADAGLLSPELAAGIRRVKGVRRLGVRLGNWLTPEQGRRLLEYAEPATPRQLRDHAMLAMLIGCGLRRGELLALTLESIQQREEHRVVADLVGKGGHVRTVPIPQWVKSAIDAWTSAARITEGPVFRAINKAGRIWGADMSPKVLWDVVRVAASQAGIEKLAPHDLRRTCARLCHLAGGELEQIQFLLGHVSVQTTERYLGCKQKLRCAVNDRIGIEPDAAA
jgi:integrase